MQSGRGTHFTRSGAGGAGEGGARRGAARLARGVGAAPDRRDPVELLEEQAQTRVPELVPIRYGRMLVSPFTFYRGAALLWPPTSPTRRAPACTCSSAAMRICRTSARSPRPTGSSSSASTTSTRRCRARSSGTSSVSRRASRSRAATAASSGQRERSTGAVRAYREAMRDFAEMRNLDLWYARLDVEDLAAAGRR